MEPPHTGVALEKKSLWDISWLGHWKKVFSIILDNALTNFIMQERLKENMKLSNSLICNGDYFYVRYCAHILNLIVQNGLTVCDRWYYEKDKRKYSIFKAIRCENDRIQK